VPPIGRVGQASDVAAAAVFYASGEAGFITGTTLLIDGGMTAGYLQRERNARDRPSLTPGAGSGRSRPPSGKTRRGRHGTLDGHTCRNEYFIRTNIYA
jgi:hypothetical protein